MMANQNNFGPNWASPPGETMIDILSQKNLAIAEFADRLERSASFTNRLISGREELSTDIAHALERVLGASTRFWLKREMEYRDDLMRQNIQAGSKAIQPWLQELPIGDMVKFGWINPASRSVSDRAEACLEFFSVPDLPSWQEKYSNIQNSVAFRTSSAFDSYPAAVAAWLRQGEIVSSSADCGVWDADRFQRTLSEIRSLTKKRKPVRFVEQLKSLCAQCGVVVAFVRAPSGCRASGATRFLTKSKALILMSFRYRTDDHFWFTFFHEAGHLLLHDKSAIFVEGAELVPTHEEDEADQFAADILISRELREEMESLSPNYRTIMKFARRIGVSPGIVVGQLQYHGRIGHNQLNYLKTRLNWLDMELL